jgi:small subunit ribosomal protein S2
MIKNKKSKVSGIKKLQRKAIRIVNWSGKKSNSSYFGLSLSRNNFQKEKKSMGLNNLKIGKAYSFKITALGPKNIGIDEFSFGYSIFIPNTQLGEIVKAKIVKIYNKNYKYAIGQVIKKIKTKQNQNINYNVGEILEVNISKLGPKGTGIAELSKNYFLIIPQSVQGQKVNVQITRLKKKFAFAKILDKSEKNSTLETVRAVGTYLPKTASNTTFTLKARSSSLQEEQKIVKIKEGSKIQLLLPADIKRFVQYIVIKINGLILLVKPTLNAKPGDLVKIKCSKVLNLKKRINLAFGKIIQVHPMSAVNKRFLVQGNLRQMLQSGIHFGEKTVKCHARMKKYIWLRKKGPNKNKPLVQKGRHLINLLKTRRCLNKALTQLSKYALKGRTFLFVGTKKSATRLIARISLFSKTSFFVNTRWLGGLLTNWKSILKSIKKIRPILKQKQTILKQVLEKRQNIKNRLMQKAIIFRKKSRVLIKKARVLVLKLQNFVPDLLLSNEVMSKPVSDESQENNKKIFRQKITQKALILDQKRKQILTKGKLLLEKRRKLIQKNYAILKQSLILKEKSVLIQNQYNNLLNELTANRKKLREFGSLLIISKYISEIQESAKQENSRLGIVSYGKLKSLISTNPSQAAIANELVEQTNLNWVIPNPPKDVINKIVLTLKAQMILNSEKNDLGSRYKELLTDSSKKIDNQKLQKVLILSKLLNQFSLCLPFIENSIKAQLFKNKELEQKLICLKETLILIKTKINYYMDLKTKFTFELNKVTSIIAQESPLVRLVRRKVKKIIAQKKLIRFLPKLRFLPTPQLKISETVKYLMTNIVDPKLKYPIEMIYDEKVKNMSKKLAAARKKRWQRLEKYFGGIAKMTKMKKNQVSKNVAIIIGQKEEMNAIRECQKLGIKMFQILDTNCNPTLADHFVPANDDSRNALEYLLKEFLVHIRLAQKLRLRLKKQKQFLKKKN